MTGEGTLTPEAPVGAGYGGPDAETGARELIAAMADDGWGRTSASVYETGRLVSLAPWLTGHAERINYLLAGQRPDGGWGPPEGYALVPTLSATEALLAAQRAGTDQRGGARPLAAAGLRVGGGHRCGVDRRIVTATGRALRALDGWLRPGSSLSLADTPAADLIVPALVSRINDHLDHLEHADRPDRFGRLDRLVSAAVGGRVYGPDGWPGGRRIPLPAGITTARLAATRAAIAAGGAVPEKLLHALEVVADLAPRARGVRPVPPGTVGASPAATAAWLGGLDGTAYPGGAAVGGPAGAAGVTGSAADRAAARRFLTEVVRFGGAGVPCATPISVFERSWVLAGLTRVGMAPAVPPALVRSLAAALGAEGAAAGPGLPADADTTSVVLYALARLGEPVTLESLWRYDTGRHFCTWLGEDGSSVTTNAHLLEALGHDIAAGAPGGARRWDTAGRLAGWLCERQESDGKWTDRWHASPYYATVCAALALDRYGGGGGTGAGRAVLRAVDWVLDTQRADGSWGRWAGTVEESAYAMQVLLAAGHPDQAGIGPAAARGFTYLVDAMGQQEDPPLWHDKDLYAPYAIVRSATLAALKLAQSRPDLMTRANLSMR